MRRKESEGQMDQVLKLHAGEKRIEREYGGGYEPGDQNISRTRAKRSTPPNTIDRQRQKQTIGKRIEKGAVARVPAKDALCVDCINLVLSRPHQIASDYREREQ